MTARGTALAALLVVAGGCQTRTLAPTVVAAVRDAAADAGEAPCDPLVGPAIGLGTIVGIGQSSTGTFYVDAENGIFVSSVDGSLIRQHIVGSGQSGTEYSYSFAAPNEDGLMPEQLVVETSGGVAVSLQLGAGGSGKLPSDGGSFVPLQLVSATALKGMPVVNTPNVISYVAYAANGYILLATVPQNAPTGATDGGISDGGLSIFYGPAYAMKQRPITAFEESLSGNGSVTFTVDGVPYVLSFGYVLGSDGGPLGTFTLSGLSQTGGGTIALMLQTPTPVALPSGQFLCL